MPNPITLEGAEILALDGLGWLAGDPAALERFFTASGVGAADLRAGAGTSETAIAILDFLLRNEDLLLRFCADAASAPAVVQAAWARLEEGPG